MGQVRCQGEASGGASYGGGHKGTKEAAIIIGHTKHALAACEWRLLKLLVYTNSAAIAFPPIKYRPNPPPPPRTHTTHSEPEIPSVKYGCITYRTVLRIKSVQFPTLSLILALHNKSLYLTQFNTFAAGD